MSDVYRQVVQQVAKAIEARLITLEAEIEVLKAKQRTQGSIIIFKGKGKKQTEGFRE